MTPARLLTEQNVTRSPFSWPYRQTDQGVRPYNATRGPFGAHQNVAKRGNSVRATPSLHPHARKAGGKQKPFSNPKKGEPKPTRQTINFSGQLSSSPRSKIVVVGCFLHFVVVARTDAEAVYPEDLKKEVRKWNNDNKKWNHWFGHTGAGEWGIEFACH